MEMHKQLYPEIDTPAVIVDLDVMERNIRRMAELAAGRGIALRPHIKTHKSVWIAKKQLEAGAVGITVAKLGEAEVMVEAGITDILLAYPIIGDHKVARLYELLRKADLILSTDSVEAVEVMADVAAAAGRRARLYVDIDTGLHRLGVPAGKVAAELVARVAEVPNTEVIGVMSHAGHTGAGRTPEEVERLAREAAESLVETAERARALGVPVRVVSPGSTVAAKYEVQVPGVTEIRPGTYVMNDANTLRRWVVKEEDCALKVLATVVSRPGPDRVVIDAGSKTLACDPAVGGAAGARGGLPGGFGLICEWPGLQVDRLSEEHGVIELNKAGIEADLQVGQRLTIIPNHVCPVVNLTDTLYGVRGGRLEREISVSARGRNR